MSQKKQKNELKELKIEEFIIRDIEARDLVGISQLNFQAWYEYEDGVEPRFTEAVSDLDVRDLISKSSWGKVVVRDNQVLGVVAVSLDEQPNELAPLVGTWKDELITLLQAPTTYINEVLAFEQAHKSSYDDIYAELNLQGKPEIQLLIVSPQAKGLGLGKKLFLAALDYIATNSADSNSSNGEYEFILKTDTSCDYKFYDHMGMTQVAARKLGDSSEFTFFVYAAKLEDILSN